jgi:DME family drug/metabolite transporter
MREARPGRWKAAVSVLAAGVLWGTTGTAQALAPAGAHPASVGFVRVCLGGLALLPFALREAGDFRLWSAAEPLGGFCRARLAGFQFFFFRGVLAAGVALGTIVPSPAVPCSPAFWAGGRSGTA